MSLARIVCALVSILCRTGYGLIGPTSIRGGRAAYNDAIVAVRHHGSWYSIDGTDAGWQRLAPSDKCAGPAARYPTLPTAAHAAASLRMEAMIAERTAALAAP